MARERWFYAEGHRRMGPVTRQNLVEALLQLTDPRTCLVWRRGLQTWTPSQDVPEIDQLLASAAGVDTRPQPPVAPAPPPPTPASETRRPAPSARSARPQARTQPPSRAPLYAGATIGVMVLGLMAWMWWPRPAPPPALPQPPPSLPTAEASSAPADPGSTAAAPIVGSEEPADVTSSGSHSTAGLADQEADLPPAELRKLRGVGGWSGDKLTITLYNGSSWRVTEIFVLTSKMEGDRFVDSVAPQLLLPVGAAPVSGAVKDLLQKVAPDRKRAGVNPSDTGPFEIVLGTQPAAYRWKIDRARGYPPRD